MQAATHLAAGATLARSLESRPVLAASLAALSHPLLDELSVATYHPSGPHWDDPFWIVHQGAAVLLALLTAWLCRRHAWILAAAMIPDLDYVFSSLGLWEEEHLHPAFRAIPVISSIADGIAALLPDLSQAPLASLFEVGLWGALMIQLLRREPLTAERPEPIARP